MCLDTRNTLFSVQQLYRIFGDMRLYTSANGWLKKNIIFYRLENYSYDPLSGMQHLQGASQCLSS